MPTAPVMGGSSRRPRPLGPLATYELQSSGVNTGAAPAPAAPVTTTAPVTAPLRPGQPRTAAGLLGGGFNASDPFGSLAAGHGGNLHQIILHLLGQGGQAGAFGPDYLRKALRRRAMMTADAQRRRSAIGARVHQLDPYQSRVAALEADNAASSGLANSLNEADLQGEQGFQEFLHSLFGSERGYQDAAQQRRAAERAQSRGMWGDLAGTVIGAAPKFFVP